MPESLEVEVSWIVRARPSASAFLARVARDVAMAEGFHRGALSIAVVGARRMSQIHLDFSGVSGATDVLTFDMGTSRKTPRRIEGEIVVCYDVARRSVSRGRSAMPARIRCELALYVTHGVLHLSGYEDHSPAGFREMHAREEQLLRGMGLRPESVQLSHSRPRQTTRGKRNPPR